MLEKTVLEWNEELREEGRQEGLQKGLQEGLQKGRREGRREGQREGEARLLIRQLELKFGPLDEETRSRIVSADPERLLEWGERILTAPRLPDIFGD